MIKAILFDVWNTLVYDKSSSRPAIEFLDFIGSRGVEEPVDFTDRHVCTREFTSKQGAAIYLSGKLGCSPEGIEPLIERFDSMEAAMFPDVLPAVERLEKDYRLALVSNIGFGLQPLKRTGIERLFDHAFYSCKVGLIKQSGLFGHALKEMGLRPQEAVMVGDCKFADIDPAEAAGIRAVLIKREGFPLHYRERAGFKRTIKGLDELDGYLRVPKAPECEGNSNPEYPADV